MGKQTRTETTKRYYMLYSSCQGGYGHSTAYRLRPEAGFAACMNDENAGIETPLLTPPPSPKPSLFGFGSEGLCSPKHGVMWAAQQGTLSRCDVWAGVCRCWGPLESRSQWH